MPPDESNKQPHWQFWVQIALVPVASLALGAWFSERQTVLSKELQADLDQKLEGLKQQTARDIANSANQTQKELTRVAEEGMNQRTELTTRAKLVEVFAPQLTSKDAKLRVRAARVLAFAGGPDLRNALAEDSDPQIRAAAKTAPRVDDSSPVIRRDCTSTVNGVQRSIKATEAECRAHCRRSGATTKAQCTFSGNKLSP
jgi:hypothetical protein